MIIKVTERCLVENEDGKEGYGLRTYYYESDMKTLEEARIDCEENFDSDRILPCTSNDDFEGCCLDSDVINVEIVE